jgi:hypothetical protein
MDMTRAKYANAVHKPECKSTELLAHACGQHLAHQTDERRCGPASQPGTIAVGPRRACGSAI